MSECRDCVIEVENLRKEFRLRRRGSGILGSMAALFSLKSEPIVAVDDVSFRVGRGELVGYLGPNGAGKSTTIKMLTGILRPSSGRIQVNAADPQRERRRVTAGIGVVFGQKTQLWWDLPVRESYDLLRYIYKVPKKRWQERLDFFISLLRLEEFLDQQTRKLSLGQRMRADLAASLLHEPQILFLDEPTIGLDILTRDLVRQFIRELNQKEKVTVLLTTHDMGDIEYLADRLILLDRGRVQYDGTLNEFNQRYSSQKIVTLHLETAADVSTLQRELSFVSQLKIHSAHHMEIHLPTEMSMAPLLEAVGRLGLSVREVSVRKQALGDTLKSLYGQSNLEL